MININGIKKQNIEKLVENTLKVVEEKNQTILTYC